MHLQRAENQPDAAEQKEFADWLLEVGEGRIPTIFFFLSFSTLCRSSESRIY